MSSTTNAALIWSVADRLRGDYNQSDYGKVSLPFTLLRRLDCVLEPTKTEKYFKRGVANYALTIQVLNESSWTPEVIEQRQRDLLAKPKDVWRL